jgi:hypothetical protein
VESSHWSFIYFYIGKAPGSAHTSKKEKYAGNTASSARNRVFTNNLDTSRLTAEQVAVYKVIHTQLEAKNKVTTATEDEGMSILTLPGYFGS